MTAPWTVEHMPDLTGQTAVVTGANSGIGFETALGLAGRGAQVVLACRSVDKARAALHRIRAQHPEAAVEVRPLDLANQTSIRSFALDFAWRGLRLDLLVNNAGIMATPRRTTVDGFEMQFGTNHLGHFALTGLLMDALLAAPKPRVVTVASVAHWLAQLNLDDLHGEQRYDPFGAYRQSKLANLLFMSELARRAEAAGHNLVSVAAHPGYAATELPAGGSRGEGSRLRGLVTGLGNRLLAQSAAMGALPTLYAATATDVRNGEYFGPHGLLELWGHPTRARRATQAHDPGVAQALWEKSTALTRVAFDRLHAAR